MVKVMRGLVELVQYEDPFKIYMILGDRDAKQRFEQMENVPDNGMSQMPIYINKDDLNLQGEYDIRIVAGSTLPTSRMEKFERAYRLREIDVYDDEAVLTYLDDPQKEDVLKRKNMMMQMQAMLEEQGGIIQAQQEQLDLLKTKGMYNAQGGFQEGAKTAAL